MKIMITKKGNVYYVVYKYKDLNGAWKKKWERAGTNKRDAEKLERKVMSDRDSGIPVSTKFTPTLSLFFSQYLETCIKPPLRALGTYENYRFCFSKVEPKIGRVRIDKLRAVHFSAAYKELLEENISVTTVRMIHRVLRAALNKACQWQLIPNNPIRYADVPKPTPSPARVLERNQFISLLKWAETRPIQERVILSLGFLCGLRDGEICGLRWQDFDGSRLYIRHTLTRRNLDGINHGIYPFMYPMKKSYLVLGDVKTDSSRNYITPPRYVLDVLKDAKGYYSSQKEEFKQSFRDLGFILHDGTGAPCSDNFVWRTVQKAIRLYNETHEDKLPRIRAHDMRHTAATVLLEENVDVKYVSRQLRHSNVSVTQNIYEHVTERMSDYTAKAMDRIVGVESGVEEAKNEAKNDAKNDAKSSS